MPKHDAQLVRKAHGVLDKYARQMSAPDLKILRNTLPEMPKTLGEIIQHIRTELDHSTYENVPVDVLELVLEELQALDPAKETPSHPSVLRTQQDCDKAPIGTIVTAGQIGSPAIKHTDDGWTYAGAVVRISGKELAEPGYQLHVLRWGFK